MNGNWSQWIFTIGASDGHLDAINLVMNRFQAISQLLMRVALGLGFIFPVLDRFGVLGTVGSPGVAWGEWKNFVKYTNDLMPYAAQEFANAGAVIATIAELVLGTALMLGIKTRLAAFASAGLTSVFALSMAIFLNPMAPVAYPVYVFIASALLLASVDRYQYCVYEPKSM